MFKNGDTAFCRRALFIFKTEFVRWNIRPRSQTSYTLYILVALISHFFARVKVSVFILFVAIISHSPSVASFLSFSLSPSSNHLHSSFFTPSFFLFIHLLASLTIYSLFCLSVCLSVSPSISLPRSLFPSSLYLSLSPSVFLPLFLPPSLNSKMFSMMLFFFSFR